MGPAKNGCPGQETVRRFIAGGLDDEALVAIERHMRACTRCAERTTWSATGGAEVNQAPRRDVRAAGAELAPGERVGRYHVLGLIGRGGMGEVYAAYHPGLDRRIAIKIVYGPRAADQERQARLLREARIIARLNHPNIVSVHDAGVVGDQVYLAMEFVDGQTLDVWLRDRNRGWDEILDVFLAAGRGLAAAHEANVIHRDFKPENVMVDRDGRVRVMDFGLARAVVDAADVSGIPAAEDIPQLPASTTVGALAGTPAYMAPEQLRGEAIDVRADQFSFCVALYEAVHGFRPGVGVWRPVPRGRRVPGWFKTVVRRGLEVDRKRRYRSMQQLLRAIECHRVRLSRRLLVLAAAVCLLATPAVAVHRMKARQFACEPPGERLEQVWGPAETAGSRRARLHQLFRSSGLTNADGIWQRVAELLDQRSRQWAAMYQDACRATHVSGEQTPEVLDLRMTCLSDVLDETRAYTDRLLASNGAVLARALSSASVLGSVDQCADVKNLQLQFPLPQEPRIRAQVVQLQQMMKDADVLASFRDDAAGERALQALLPAVRQLGFRPLVAQALQKLGAVEANLQRLPEGEQLGAEALSIAEASHDDLTAAKAADTLAYVEAHMGRLEDAQRWLRFGDAVVERLSAQGSLVAAWLVNEWSVLYTLRGDLAAAERTQRQTLALKTKLLGARHADVAASLANLAQILDEMDRSNEAYAQIHAALDAFQGYASVPVLPNLLTIEAEIAVHLGRWDEAEQALRRVRDILDSDPGLGGQFRVAADADWADLLFLQNRSQEALEVILGARRMLAGLPLRLPVLDAALDFTLARILLQSRARTGDAATMISGACQTFERFHSVRRRRELLAWFNALPMRAGQAPATTCSDLPGVHAARSAPPPVRQLQQDHVRRRAVAERPG